jgi:mRNA-decapping enzyme 1B
MASVTNKVSDDVRRKANLRVLQRLDSSINDIVESATHVGLYEFKQDAQAWEKRNVEGSLFLVKRNDVPRFQLQILNRNSTDNWTLPVFAKMQLQNQDPYLIVRFQNPDGETVIQGIWFHNGQERNAIAAMLMKAMKALELTPDIDHGTAASVLLSPLNLGGHTIPISRAPASPYVAAVTSTSVSSSSSVQQEETAATSAASIPAAKSNLSSTHEQPPSTPVQTNQQHFVLDKKSLQLSLLSLIQDDRFLDLIHAQYLKVAHARANRKPTETTSNGGS